MSERTYRGSKIVPVRIDDATLSAIQAIVDRSVLHSKHEPYTVSSWIKKVISDEIKHLERGRRKPKKLAPIQGEEVQISEPGEIYAAEKSSA